MEQKQPESLVEQITETRHRVEALVRGRTPEQLTTQPKDGEWSIAERLAYLNMTAATVQELLAHGIGRGKQEKKFGGGPFSIGLPSLSLSSEFARRSTSVAICNRRKM
jgi:hypothetical protein